MLKSGGRQRCLIRNDPPCSGFFPTGIGDQPPTAGILSTRAGDQLVAPHGGRPIVLGISVVVTAHHFSAAGGIENNIEFGDQKRDVKTG